jgi:hypothetical protein
MTATEVLWKGQVRIVQDAVDAWAGEGCGPLSAAELELLFRVAEVLRDCACMTMRGAWDSLFSGRVRNVQATGERYGRIFDITLRILDTVRREAEAAQIGQEVSGYKKLLGAVEDVLRLKEDFEARWPHFDPASVERGAAEAARGEFVDFEEICREFPELQDAPHP